MCIRDSHQVVGGAVTHTDSGAAAIAAAAVREVDPSPHTLCLLYTSDAADERSSVDLGGRRIIKKKKLLVVAYRSFDVLLQSYTS